MDYSEIIDCLLLQVPTAGFSDSCLCDSIPHSCWKSELRSAAQGQCLALRAVSVPISWTYIYRSPGDWPSLPSLRVGAQGRAIHMYRPPPLRPHSPPPPPTPCPSSVMRRVRINQRTLTNRKESKVQSAPGIILNRYRADHSLSIEKPRSAVKGASGWGRLPRDTGWPMRSAVPQQFRFMFMFREQSVDWSILPGTDCGLQLRQTAPQRDVSAWSQRRWMLLISWSFASVS